MAVANALSVVECGGVAADNREKLHDSQAMSGAHGRSSGSSDDDDRELAITIAASPDPRSCDERGYERLLSLRSAAPVSSDDRARARTDPRKMWAQLNRSLQCANCANKDREASAYER